MDWITDGCGSGAYHGQERPDYETSKIYRWNSHTGTWVYNREMRILGFSIEGVWADEVEDFQPDSRSETSGEADNSEW